MRRGLAGLLLLVVIALFLSACGGGGGGPTSSPPTLAPTLVAAPAATAPPSPAETPPVAPTQVAGPTPFGECLEARLGPEVAKALVSGQRGETAGEEAVLEGCLAAAAAGVVAEAISPTTAACVEAGLGAGVLRAVGSGAQQLTPQQESVLEDCLLAATLGAAFGGATSSVAACLREGIGAEAAQLILSGGREVTEQEEAVLADCLLVSALSAPAAPVSADVSECLEQRVGAESARAIAAGARQLTADEQAVLGDCVLASALGATTGTVSFEVAACLQKRLGAEAAQAIVSNTRQVTPAEQTALGDCVLASAFAAAKETTSPAVAACLQKRLGAEAAQAIVSNTRKVTANEQAVMGDCVLASALAPAKETTSPAVAACLQKRLGAEAAQAVASGSRELSAEESSVLGSCLLEAALGAKR